jgi:hypothetical protein
VNGEHATTDADLDVLVRIDTRQLARRTHRSSFVYSSKRTISPCGRRAVNGVSSQSNNSGKSLR